MLSRKRVKPGETREERAVSKIREPNYTQVPNVFFDEIMIGMSKAQLLVMLAVCRQTFGWHRASCQLSLSDLQKLTG